MFQSTGSAGFKEGLENTLALDALLDHPHESFRSIHIAGTNGKGSVTAMLSAVLREAGYKTGAYTSPHLKDFRERMTVDGEMITEGEVIEFIERMRPHIESLKPSFFEITTVMAFDFFRRRGVEIAVVETGMGGRMDCTNIISPLLSVITNVSYDHTQYLGDTLPKIAGEKAGIIKPGIPVVVGEFQPETAPVFIATAREKESPIRFASQCYRCVEHTGPLFRIENLHDGYRFELECGLTGDYQRLNICTALSVFDLLNGTLENPLSREQIRTGLSRAFVPGRWQTIGTDPCPIICDTAHNEAGLRLVLEQLSKVPRELLYIVLGMVSDKDIPGMLSLFPKDASYIFTQADLPRALPAAELAKTGETLGLYGEMAVPVRAALEKARTLAGPGDLIFVGGSTFTVAEVL